jgi:MoxR-like ATPase
MSENQIAQQAEQFRKDFATLKAEIGKVVVGHEEIVEGVLMALFAGGHVLLEGVPGLGKTLLVRTLSEAMALKFSRIQFTPDLMPADVLGTNLVVEVQPGRREFQFQQGPIFAQIVLADEINRATPKTQSALLEAMQEQSVTAGGSTRKLEPPFLVLATQNPLEMEGTYPLPEAQLDRFFFKLLVEYSSREDLSEVLRRTTEGISFQADKVLDAAQVMAGQEIVRQVVLAPHVKDYVVRLVLSSHPQGQFATESVNRFVRYGASPRGAQALALAGKIKALLDGRYNVAFEDISACAKPALRHRMILNFEGEAEGVTSDKVIEEMVEKTPQRAEDIEKVLAAAGARSKE